MNYSFEKLKQYFKELNPLSNVHLFLGCTFPVDTLSPGARYLYEHVIFELMKGREIFTGQLDMEQFHLEDIQEAVKFYVDQIESNLVNCSKHQRLYQKVKSSVPQVGYINFL